MGARWETRRVTEESDVNSGPHNRKRNNPEREVSKLIVRWHKIS